MINYKQLLLDYCDMEIKRKKFEKPENIHWAEWKINHPIYLKQHIKEISDSVNKQAEIIKEQMLADSECTGDIYNELREMGNQCKTKILAYQKTLEEI